jgi:hypothetical protein
MTSVNEQKIAGAVAAAKRANSPEEREREERLAIAAYRQIALDNGLDETLHQRGMRDGRNAAGLESDLTLRDIQRLDKSLRGLFWWGVLASFLNDLRLGPYRKKEGEGVINAAKAASEGRRSWLMRPITRQGVKPEGEKTDALYYSVVALAATYDAETGCGIRAALHYAVAEFGVRAAALGVSLDPESLRRRVNTGRRGKDKLAAHYTQIFKLALHPDHRDAMVRADCKLAAMNATIRGKTSHSDKG